MRRLARNPRQRKGGTGGVQPVVRSKYEPAGAADLFAYVQELENTGPGDALYAARTPAAQPEVISHWRHKHVCKG